MLSCTPKNKIFIHGHTKHGHRLLGEYSHLYTRTNGILGINVIDRGHGIKAGYLMSDRKNLDSDYNARLRINDINLRPSYSWRSAKVGGFRLCDIDCKTSTTECTCVKDSLVHSFGSSVSLQYFYDEEERINTLLYMPKMIEAKLTSSSDEYGRYEIRRSDFRIKRNQDEKNDKGILLTVLYHNDEHEKSKLFEKRSILVDDSGTYTFSNQFFKDIPSGALVDITLTRGSIPIINDIDGNSYTIKLISEFTIGTILD